MNAARFLDTNIFLRYLLDDDEVKAPACRALFESVEERLVAAWTSDLVVAEVVYVLSNKRTYGFSRDEISSGLLPLLGLPGLDVAGKHLYPRVFDLYRIHPIDFIDCYHIALIEMRQPPELYSYDVDFDRVPSVVRHEPWLAPSR